MALQASGAVEKLTSSEVANSHIAAQLGKMDPDAACFWLYGIGKASEIKAP